MPQLTIKDIGDIYGSLNELSANPGPSADRRDTTTTEALSTALASIYTPDALAGKTTFLGIVLINYPTKLPRQGSKQELIHTPRENSDDEPGDRLYPYYDVYKVYIPELEPIPLNWDTGKPGPNEMTLQQRVMTFDDVIPAADILRDNPGPIPAGTIVAVEYEDLSQLRNPRIVGVSGGGPAFDINLDKGKSSIINAFHRGTGKISPADMPWYNQALQGKTYYESETISPELNNTLLKNGEIHLTPGLMTQYAEGVDQLLTPAYNDWIMLRSAYERNFPGNTLHGSGYRTYEGQVNSRERRIPGDNACGGTPRCFTFSSDDYPRGTGISSCNKNCSDIGVAAIPGTSKHGWGSAIDIKPGWAHPCTQTRKGLRPDLDETTCNQAGAVTNEKWKWLVQHGSKYNFIFNVRGEHWHMGWTKISAVTEPPLTNIRTTNWDSTGLLPEISYGPGPSKELLAAYNNTPKETAERIAAENAAAATAKAKQDAADEAAAIEAKEQEEEAQKKKAFNEDQLRQEMACTEAAMVNLGVTATDIETKRHQCRQLMQQKCTQWAGGQTADSYNNMTGPKHEVNGATGYLDCAGKPWVSGGG